MSSFGSGNAYLASSGGTYATTGTLRLDMVTISGTAVPEPNAILFGAVCCILVGVALGGKQLFNKSRARG